ncbi:hypothetical protein J5N97_021055 [Dioscorea zingiberensis]|uniref:Proline-rich family protein n=1 Tax=Dioscorea zingiberensis TaxID=325984 RepID=A0A9D5HDW4_9LILI|nr:hypothetical protein J5N97_021055 [Dioscorea zingiberensis]
MKTKDDDLTLFNDMESKDSDNFLLQSADDLNDSIARLRYYSDLSVNIPARGETSDMLNVNGEKNDYDWLLTPPDTPLFRSLDDEEVQPVNLTPRGRQQSQPISIRSSTTEKPQRTSRSSYSPHRLSPSPRSSTNVTQPKGTPSSAPHSSPTALRPATPSRRPSTPPNKPSAITPRSSTPTLRRMSTGSSGQASSPGRRGTSPVRASRGNSASPKLRGWQTNVPGFSSDSPSNLRTSQAELPSSITRGLSPASRNGRQSTSPTAPRNRRQSMSPTASRSTTSLQSHERDHFSTYSKGSAASSGDDDVDSLYSLGVEISSSPTSGKNEMVANSRAIPFSKKPVRTPSTSSAPKRSFDSALRQDHRKTPPQNMFRPLLSSVPTTTFYNGKVNSVHRPLFSRNSSVTTSSNASSELGVIVAPDMVDVGDHNQNDLAGEWEKPQDFDTQEEILIFGKMDEINENGHSLGGVTNKVDLEVLEKSAANFGDPVCMTPTSESSCPASISSKADCFEILTTCSKCGKQFHIMDANLITEVCQECAGDDWLSSAQNENLLSMMLNGIDSLLKERQPTVEIPELPEKNSVDELPVLQENCVEQVHEFLPSSSACNSEADLTEQYYSNQQPKSCQEVKAIESESKFQEPHVTHPSPRVSSLEGTGISVLLQRSSSSKWPVIQGRAFSATSIQCSEPSYTRDPANAMRRSFSRDSASASSSVDLGSSRQSEFRVQRQLSNRKVEINMRNDSSAKAQISESLNSGVSSDVCGAKTEIEEAFNGFVDSVEVKSLGKREPYNDEHNNSSCTHSTAIAEAVIEGEMVACADICIPMDSSKPKLMESMHVCNTSLADFSEDGDLPSCCITDGLRNNGSAQDAGAEPDIRDSSGIGEEYMLNGSVCGNDSDVARESSSCVVLLSQITNEVIQDLQSDSTSSNNLNNMDVGLSEKDSALESNLTDQPHEKPIIKVEGPRGYNSRSLTLEEATETILFCSSIIHDLAYKAATKGLEKEESVMEPLRPTVPSKGNTISNLKDSWMSSYKQTPKPQKTKRTRLETTETNTTVTELGDNTKVQNTMPANPAVVPNKVDSAKPPKLESKCNCTIM